MARRWLPTTRLRVSDTTRLPLVTMLLTLTQLAHTGLAAKLPVVDFGRWFFAEHRCPQMARKNFSFDVPERSTDGFTSSSPEVRPPNCLCWSVTRHSPLTEGTTGSISYCKRRRNTDSNVSAILPNAPNMSRGRWCPPFLYQPHNLSNYSILIRV